MAALRVGRRLVAGRARRGPRRGGNPRARRRAGRARGLFRLCRASAGMPPRSSTQAARREIVLTNDNLIGGWSEAGAAQPSLRRARGGRAAARGACRPRASRLSPSPWRATSRRPRDCANTPPRVTSLDRRRHIAFHSRRALSDAAPRLRESGIAVRLDAAAPGEQSPPPAVWGFTDSAGKWSL